MTAIWTILTSMAAMRRAGGARGATRPQLSVRLRKQNASEPEGSVRSTVNARREINEVSVKVCGAITPRDLVHAHGRVLFQPKERLAQCVRVEVVQERCQLF